MFHVSMYAFEFYDINLYNNHVDCRGKSGTKSFIVKSSIPKGGGRAEFKESNHTYSWKKVCIIYLIYVRFIALTSF